MKYATLALSLGLIFNSHAAVKDNEGAFLDPQYKNLKHPTYNPLAMNKAMKASDTVSVIKTQSSVKSQAARGTCSIFSATAYLEGLMIAKGMNPTLDLSEEWLQYTAVRNKMSDGSGAWANFGAIRDYGMPSEQSLPYIGEDWTEVESPLKTERCGKLFGFSQKSCFIVHRDPSLLMLTDTQINSLYGDKEFIKARKEATAFKSKNIKFENGLFSINSVEEVKALLDAGTPVVLELDFYYGAWNHREADDLGIGRDLNHWAKGIVTSPEKGSVDEKNSQKEPAGHSVLVVGYDDNKVVTKIIKMADGTTKKFTYKGVYYFKNSWGTSSFGKDFELEGEKFPGYGMIVYKYANDLGEFYQMPLK